MIRIIALAVLKSENRSNLFLLSSRFFKLFQFLQLTCNTIVPNQLKFHAQVFQSPSSVSMTLCQFSLLTSFPFLPFATKELSQITVVSKDGFFLQSQHLSVCSELRLSQVQGGFCTYISVFMAYTLSSHRFQIHHLNLSHPN